MKKELQDYAIKRIRQLGGNNSDIVQILEELEEIDCSSVEIIEAHLENYYL